jgi:hypothetical protein
MVGVVAIAKPGLKVVAVVVTWVRARGICRQDESIEEQEQDMSKRNNKTRARREQRIGEDEGGKKNQ